MPRVRMPHKVRVGNKLVPIDYPEIVLALDGSGEELSGQCDPINGKISISRTDNTSRKLLRSTLLHEVIHYMLYVSGQASVLERAHIDREEGVVITLEINLLPTIDWKSKMWQDWKLIDLIEDEI